jgi:hypothetical protein
LHGEDTYYKEFMRSLQSANPKWEGVAGVALDVDDEFTGVVADVDELPDVFVRDVMSRNIRDVMSPNLGDSSRDSAGDSWGDSISCNGYVKDDRDGGSRLYCRSDA